ncbi:DNA damage-inducible protein DinB [Syncephalis fuscata]|nr:DNA damage-inducible protein DinB [Syncephalis fuscata]
MTATLLWKQHFLKLAQYNVWAYQVLLDSVKLLSDEHFSAYAGLCFRSIHGTLNHLSASEGYWAFRLDGQMTEGLQDLGKLWMSPEKFSKAGDKSSIWEQHIPERHRVIEAIQKSSARLLKIVEDLPDSHDFESTIAHIGAYEEESATSCRIALTHAFNHSTHHRGQISGAITQFGLPPPSMDLIYHPGSTWTQESNTANE